MITKLPQEFLSVISQNNGLKVYLSNLDRKIDSTPRSWLYENKEPKQILDEWLDRLQSLQSGDAFEKEVFQFDTSQLEKWGPQGGHAPISELLEDIVLPTFSRADSPRPKAFTMPNWTISKTQIVTEFYQDHVAALRPASYSNVVNDMRARDTLESNSGWPLFTRRNKPDVLKASIQAATDGAWMDYPAIALFRNYNRKTRLVWMFPEATNINEGSFVQPLQSSIINAGIDFYAPWKGFERVRHIITQLYGTGKYLSASDFSKTDEHFTMSATLEVFDVLRNLFQRNDAVAAALRQSLVRMHNIPLIIGPDKMITGEHGVSSGSNWTNFIETVLIRFREVGC
nr:RNA-dependent RNA polymerase [Marmot picobirnavirus]